MEIIPDTIPRNLGKAPATQEKNEKITNPDEMETQIPAPASEDEDQLMTMGCISQAARKRPKRREGGEEEERTDDETIDPVEVHQDPFCPVDEGGEEQEGDGSGRAPAKKGCKRVTMEHSQPRQNKKKKGADEDGNAHEDHDSCS